MIYTFGTKFDISMQMHFYWFAKDLQGKVRMIHNVFYGWASDKNKNFRKTWYII